MALNNLYLLYLLYVRKNKNLKRRRQWIHPIIRVRYLEGSYYTLFEKLTTDENKFFNYFRMSSTTYEYILANISDEIKKKDTQFRMSIPPPEMLTVTIR